MKMRPITRASTGPIGFSASATAARNTGRNARNAMLGLPYSRQICVLQPHIDALTHLAIDAGGSGQGLPEHIRGVNLERLVPMVITGGTGKGRVVNGRVSVGKTHLIQGMMQMIYHRELRVDPEAPGRDILKREMQMFRYLPGGRFVKMEAKTGEHDDAVVACALAAHLARRTVEPLRMRKTSKQLSPPFKGLLK